MSLQRQYRSNIQGTEVAIEDENEDDANSNDLKLVSDYLKESNVDILLEIFARLPNCRSAILCASVCRYWHSVIYGPQFIPRFISHHGEHQDLNSLPYTIIFRRADRIGLGHSRYDYYQPLCKLLSEESMFLHGNSATSARYLDFLPCRMVVRASCNDLLLAYPGGRESLGKRWSDSDDLYICNPITKQFYRLPEFDRPNDWFRITGHALICIPPGSTLNHFKVVEFYDLGFGDDVEELANSEAQSISYVMSVFCSKSREWVRESFQCPRPNGFDVYRSFNEIEEVVACNGIAYWLENNGDVDMIIKLDLSSGECGVIVFPYDFMWFRQPGDDEKHSFLWRYRRYGDSHLRGQIGAVCGELRLLQVVLTGEDLVLNLQNLEIYYQDWVSVHGKKNLKRPSSDDEFTAAFVHPTNGDVAVLVWGKNIFQYNLNILDEEGAYEKMGELKESLDIGYQSEQAEQFGWNERLVSVPMVHPPWPTPLPS